MKIMFVCTGNICRSPLAEAVFRQMADDAGVGGQFEIRSSGTTAYHVGQAADERMRAVSAAHGVEIRNRSKQLTRSDIDGYDLILAMDRSNLREIGHIAGSSLPKDRVRLFREYDPQGGIDSEVPDPYYGGQSGFEGVFAMVERTCAALLTTLRDLDAVAE
ncbi:MAG TPA: low molecular weight protein-tyrosine-phosphatase [Spirochaetia bacterium]|nr:low molecular weight protein-tyrosine-phosphatase [Spirochaetia bacterium]